MKLKHTLTILSLLSVNTTAAFANWQPYIGISPGFLYGTFSTQVNNPPIYSHYMQAPGNTSNNTGPYNFSATASQFSPGVQIGIATQNTHAYWGFEASFWYNNNTYTSNTIIDNAYNPKTFPNPSLVDIANNQVISNIKYNGSLSTQLGYFLTQKFMPFVKVGIAGANADVTYNFNHVPYTPHLTSGTMFSTSYRPWMFGPIASIGAQYSLTKNFRAFAEASYLKL